MKGYIVYEDRRFHYLEKLLEENGDDLQHTWTDLSRLDYVVLGLKGPNEQLYYLEEAETMMLPKHFFASLKPGCRLYTFNENPFVSDMAKKYLLKYDTFSSHESVVNGNADLTSEAVLAYLIQKRPVRLQNSTISILGYGHLAKSLLKYLSRFTKTIYIACRSEQYDQDIAELAIPVRLNNDAYLKADIVINTIPARVLNDEKLQRIGSNQLVLDVSSFPYGFDLEKAFQFGINAEILPGLPGKYAYQDAAQLLCQVILEGNDV